MPRRGHVPLEYAQSAVPVNMSTVYAERRRLSTVSRPAAGRDAAGAASPCSAVAGHPAVLKNQVVDVAGAGPEVFHGGVLLALRAIGQSMQGRGKSFLSIFFWPGWPADGKESGEFLRTAAAAVRLPCKPEPPPVFEDWGKKSGVKQGPLS